MEIQGAVRNKRIDVLGWGLFFGTFLASAFLAVMTIFWDWGTAWDRQALSLIGHPFHFVLEMASILVCLTIFLVAVFSYPFISNAKLLAAGLTFFASGVLDAVHLIGDNGIALFPHPEQLGLRSAVFQIISRLILAFGLMFAINVAENRKDRSNAWLWFLLEVTVIVAIMMEVVRNPLEISWLRADGQAGSLIHLLQYFTALFLLAGLGLSFRRYRKSSHDRMYLMMAAALVLLLGSEAIATNVPPHSMYGDGIAHAIRFIAQLLLFDIFYVSGIRKPYQMLSEAKDALNHYVNELDREVAARTTELTDANQRLTADMVMARDIQRAMLPVTLPQNEYLRFTAGYLPAEQLSGDFYDVFRIDGSRYGFCLGDVAGHGVSAAMLTVFAFQSVQSLREDAPESGMTSPAFVVKHLYDSFNAASFRDELYLVLIYCVYNVETGVLSWASGGLNTVPIRLRPDGSLKTLDLDGIAICKMGDFIKPQYQNRQLLIFPGDKVIFFTDGLVEARSPTGELYSQERLQTLLQEGSRLDAETLRETVLADVRAFTGGRAPADDITLLILEINLPF